MNTSTDASSPMDSKSPADILDAMAKTFRERNAIYGNSFEAIGDVFVALFPAGLTLTTRADFLKFHIFNFHLAKTCRFAMNGMNHVDSMHDIGVYAAIAEFLLTKNEVKK